MNDALGNEVVLGQKYGYSAKDTVFIGRAVGFTKTRVTLETFKRRCFRYGEEDLTWHLRYPPAATTSIPAWHLFPVPDQ
jgi:hypothetical protein